MSFPDAFATADVMQARVGPDSTASILGTTGTGHTVVRVPWVTGIEDAVTGSRQCYSYDGFNRLGAAWTELVTEPVACDDAPVATDTFWEVDDTSYATTWAYSDSGRISSIVNLVTGGTSTTSTFAYTDPTHPHAVTGVTDGVTPDSFTYDEAGRQKTRTVDTVTTDLTWDVLSNLVSTTGQGGNLLYVYDASGQRVAKVNLTAGEATAYLGVTELTDTNTAVNHTDDAQLVGSTLLEGTRFYSFGGATVAVRDGSQPLTTGLSLLLGDSQGSAQVMMEVKLNGAGAMLPATTTDPITRSSYMPYGSVRGNDELSIDHGWLNQTEDTDTGLTYLNARYYDPVASRFLSPDPLINPQDPKTLDAYMYATNNPVTFQDASGLCYGLSADKMEACATGWSTSQARMLSVAQVYNSVQYANALKPIRATARQGIDFAFDKLDEWIYSDDGQFFLGYADTEKINDVIPGATLCKTDGGIACLGAGFDFAGMRGALAYEYLAKLFNLYQKDGEWDLKPYMQREYGIYSEAQSWLPINDKHEMNYDVLGNAIYGATMNWFNIDLDEAIFASRGSGNPDPADDEAIRLGYEWGQVWRDDLSLGTDDWNADNMWEHLTSPESLQRLLEVGRVRSREGAA